MAKLLSGKGIINQSTYRALDSLPLLYYDDDKRR